MVLFCLLYTFPAKIGKCAPPTLFSSSSNATGNFVHVCVILSLFCFKDMKVTAQCQSISNKPIIYNYVCSWIHDARGWQNRRRLLLQGTLSRLFSGQAWTITRYSVVVDSSVQCHASLCALFILLCSAFVLDSVVWLWQFLYMWALIH